MENRQSLTDRFAYFQNDFLRDSSTTVSTLLDVIVHKVTLGGILHQYAEVPRVEFILFEETVIELDKILAG